MSVHLSCVHWPNNQGLGGDDMSNGRYGNCAWCGRTIDVTNKDRDLCDVCARFPTKGAMRDYAYQASKNSWPNYDKKLNRLVGVIAHEECVHRHPGNRYRGLRLAWSFLQGVEEFLLFTLRGEDLPSLGHKFRFRLILLRQQQGDLL